MNEERLTELFARYSSGESIGPEEEEFMDLAALPEHKDLLETLIQELLERVPGKRSMDGEAVQNTLQAIFQSRTAPVISMRRKKYRPWMAAAAVLLLVIGSALYFILGHESRQGTEMIAGIKDLPAPSVSHATIRLGNGRLIRLDSVNSGIIASQGKTTLSKADDGSIRYNGRELPGGQIIYNTLTNPKGSRVINLELADGSRVWLNAGSELRYFSSNNGKDRMVMLNGEAYFEVAHDQKRPFIVQKNNNSIRVLGTKFNVNAYDDEQDFTVTLLEGSVKLNNGVADAVLSPGQQAKINREQAVRIDSNAQTEEAIAWKEGWFRFNRTDVQSIMRQVSRWYDVEVSYDSDTGLRKFSGIISRQSNMSQVLNIFQGAGIRFRMEGKQIIVTQ